jgi:DNA-binding response OmpR family regulator
MRLLLVEDEPSLRESVARKLHRAGYETDDCGDGETALEMLAAERYDLVLLDLSLHLKHAAFRKPRFLFWHNANHIVLIFE